MLLLRAHPRQPGAPMERPAVRVHLCPDPEGDRAFHLLLDALAKAIAEDIFQRARKDVGGDAPTRLALDEAQILGLEPVATTGRSR